MKEVLIKIKFDQVIYFKSLLIKAIISRFTMQMKKK